LQKRKEEGEDSRPNRSLVSDDPSSTEILSISVNFDRYKKKEKKEKQLSPAFPDSSEQ
jgi:hypothetical protein